MRIPKVAVWRVTFWSGKIKVAVVEVLAPTKLLARLAVRDALLAPEHTLQRERYLSARLANTIDRVTYGRTRQEVVGRSTWGTNLPHFAKRAP